MSMAEQSVFDLSEVPVAIEGMVAQAQSFLKRLKSKSEISPQISHAVGHSIASALRQMEGVAFHLRGNLIEGKVYLKVPGGAERGVQEEIGRIAERFKSAEGLVNEVTIVNMSLAVNGLGPLPKITKALSDISGALSELSMSLNGVEPASVDEGYVASINAQWDLFEISTKDAIDGWEASI